MAANWRILAERAAPAECAAVVKADGYGLGAAPVASSLLRAGCRTFFVALPAEAVAVRAAVGDAPVVGVLAGYLPEVAELYRRHRLSPVLSTMEQVAAWRAHRCAVPAFIHVDTGINRLGMPPDHVEALAAQPELLAGLELALVMSHLACADEPAHALNAAQLKAFRAALAASPTPLPGCFANSSGIFLGPDYHFAMVRPGVALYGVNPTPGRPNPMRPVVTLRARILQVRQVDRGESVGYGATFVASSARKLATVAVGYADGLHRALSNRGRVACHSCLAPIVGRVSMDMITIDISELPHELARPGSEVTIIGPDYDVDAIAADAGTIGYEMLTSLGRRYQRRYHGAGAPA